ncbi:hypothetical protein PBY51_021622 [Eleginops maclovinus]|uniref:Uncharacterized protein n=1 Tax=Eleginops maclovinus TaxID=56733 RepID=A0AAN7XGD0_ELEMC|nr:hypothetical protein PBY51_021622 [Eleginops maclovinus]
MLGGVLTVFVAPLLCIQEVSGDQDWSLGSKRKVLAPGGLPSPLALTGLLGKPGRETVEWGGGEGLYRSK